LGDRLQNGSPYAIRPLFCPVCLSDSVCLSVCLSVTLMYCGQTVERIKMKLGMQVGIGPGHIVLDEDPGLPPQRQAPPIFGPYLLWPNGSMDQDATWYECRPWPRPHCVTWRPSSLLPSRKGTAPNFRHVYCGQTVARLGYTAEHLLHSSRQCPRASTQIIAPSHGNQDTI